MLLCSNTIDKKNKDAYVNEAQTIINFRVLFHIMNLAISEEVHPQVNAIATQKLKSLSTQLAKSTDAISAEMVNRIKNFQEYPDKFEVVPSPKIPDGSPIGMDCFH